MRVELPTHTATELALPDGPATRGVVIVPDIAGLRPLFVDLAARLALDYRWAVAVFDPFPGRELPTIDDRFAAVPTLDDAAVLADAVAAADLLTAQAATERVAIMGFCMGGMYAYKAASTGRFDRCVPFYGMIRLPVAWRGPGQGEPLQALGLPGTCPVLSIIGGRDPYTPPDDVAELARFGPLVTPVRYPEAEHGFVHDPTRPAHRAEDAADAWRRVVEFLA